jgi:hypothetical protein
LQLQKERRLEAREQRKADYDDAMLALERAKAARAQGDYERAEREFARSARLHELQSQVTQAALANDPTKWNPDAALQAAASVGNVAPELAPDVMGWAHEQSVKFNPPPKIGRGAPGSVAYDERTGLPIPGSQIPEKPAAPTAASLATAAAAGDEKAKAALDLLQNREHSTTNVDLALRAVNGDAKAEAALKLLKPAREVTPTAGLDATLKLRDRFTRETTAAQTVNTQLQLMKSSLQAAEQGNMAAGSQGVLVTFQKILDPTSVVRESEYARSAAGQALLSRIEGAYDRLSKGGAGVPVSELKQFVTLAEQFARNQAESAKATKQQIDNIATEYGLKPENITREFGQTELSATAPPISTDQAQLDEEYQALKSISDPADATNSPIAQWIRLHPDYVPPEKRGWNKGAGAPTPSVRPMSSHAPTAPRGPKVGTMRTANGETRFWTGSKWELVKKR